MKRFLQFLAAVVLIGAGSLLAWAQASAPEISYDGNINLLKTPNDVYLGEVAGVATNSKGHIFVYTRTGTVNATLGTNRIFIRNASRLFEFDASGRYIREIGQHMYGFVYAQGVRIDPQDNIWVVDLDSSMIMKFDPEGRFVMGMGRKPENINIPNPVGYTPPPRGGGGGEGGGGGGAPGAGAPGDSFNRPTDVAWDSDGNIYIADGLGNARIAKFDKTGKFVKSWGQRGSAPGQFNLAAGIAIDSNNNVYVADKGNKRIQVFDSNGDFKSAITNIGTPWAICISSGPHQYLYSSNSNATDSMDNGQIYKMELDGTVLGQFGKAGKRTKEFGTVNEIDCRDPNNLLVGEITNWRVQKLTLHPATQSAQR